MNKCEMCLLADNNEQFVDDFGPPIEPMQSDEESIDDNDTDDDTIPPALSTSSASRGRRNFITSRTVAALDNAKVTDRMAVHIIIAIAMDLGHSVNELVINRSTLRNLRRQHRKQESENIQSEFIDNVIQS